MKSEGRRAKCFACFTATAARMAGSWHTFFCRAVLGAGDADGDAAEPVDHLLPWSTQRCKADRECESSRQAHARAAGGPINRGDERKRESRCRTQWRELRITPLL